MNITVVGLWHLGSVTAACCARHFHVTALDFDPAVVARLQQAQAPVFELGLNELLQEGLQAGRLRFVSEAPEACAQADLLWLCADTPVDDHDESDVAAVLNSLRLCLSHCRPGVLVLVSSQVPVGTCRSLESEFAHLHFAYSPENLRLGRALETFQNAERVIIGLREPSKRPMLEELFAPFTRQIIFMRTESAEMVKHALNSFLALSITFINEIARLCEQVGADAQEVSTGLKSDPRIGSRAYLGPGGPFAGGTLARDVVTLTRLAAQKNEKLNVIPAVKSSNDEHRAWMLRKLQARLGDLRGRVIALLGLVYTPHTDTLRRSAAVELCHELLAQNARVQAFDPAIRSLPVELTKVHLSPDLETAVAGADAVVICTEWPEFRQAAWADLIRTLHQPVFIDANNFLEKQLAAFETVEHFAVGRLRRGNGKAQ